MYKASWQLVVAPGCVTDYAGNENKVFEHRMKISRRAGIDLMPRSNHRVIPGAPGLYAAEIRSVVVWFNRGLWTIARGICHTPVAPILQGPVRFGWQMRFAIKIQKKEL